MRKFEGGERSLGGLKDRESTVGRKYCHRLLSVYDLYSQQDGEWIDEGSPKIPTGKVGGSISLWKGNT